MNLLDRAWIPFKHRDGDIRYRPAGDLADSDTLDVAFPRADFQGAAYQWLIGLLQTAFAPGDESDWMRRFATPPTTAELNAAFERFAYAFELDGDGPRFMQDIDPLDDAKPGPVAGLLIDAPGANGIKNNTDFFVKRGQVEAVCPDCAAIALFTMQINAPSGGVGYRVGLRGGGPLTTLILPEDPKASLWHRLWLNVLLPEQIRQRGQRWTPPVADDAAIFPWMDATRTSKQKGSEVLPDSVHPLHAYWAMPRRYRLLFEPSECTCDLCGRAAARSICEIKAQNYGANYAGPWQHPLTPYRIDPDKPEEAPLSRKGQPGGLGYRHWPQWVVSEDDNSSSRPAAVVHHYVAGKVGATRDARQWGDDVELLYSQARLWVFGYDMNNMKPRGWYATEMPVMTLPDAQLYWLRRWASSFIDFATGAAWILRTQIKAAWFDRPADAKGDLGDIDLQFHASTQNGFYRALGDMQAALAESADLERVPSGIAQTWYRHVRLSALRQFETQALSGPVEETAIRRVIMARRNLLYWLNHNKTVKAFADEGGFELRSSDPQTTHEKVNA